jgi:protein transport protein SEC61 subunit gamma-like protein
MLKKFLYECKRTLQVARKPNRDEYYDISKVTGLGILLIGLLGFLITMGAILILGG